MTRLSSLAIVAIVLLRLASGWHFFNEGVKKLDPDFTSVGFSRGAKGPLAPVFQALAGGPYGAVNKLLVPVEAGTRDSKAQQELDAWRADYAKRTVAALDQGAPLPKDMPESAPGADWVKRIARGWESGLERLGRLGLDGVAAEQARSEVESAQGKLVAYLANEGSAIEDARHEAWRLANMQQAMRSEAGTPSQWEQINAKQKKVWSSVGPWIDGYKQISATLTEKLASIGEASGIDQKRITSAMAERSLVSWVDFAVTCVVLGSGVCLFLGFLTPLAGVLAAGFLASLIMTQPPWVAGADTSALFSWLVEMFALLALAAIGAGRWVGIDGLFGRLVRIVNPPKTSR